MPGFKLLAALVVLLVAAADTPAMAQEEARLLRFPAIHGGQIAFSYGGDLYAVPADGGVARKLTTDDGYEMFPRFSPDGRWLAFTGQYDGNTEVYVIPAKGGVPKRLTFTATLNRDDVADRMGPNNLVMGWTPDGKHIVFRSRMRSFNDFLGQLYTVPLDGGLPEPLPLPRGGFCSYAPDGKKLAYNRVFREFRTWKRYRGGMADDVWIYDFATRQTEPITHGEASDIIPMWSGNRVYFLSDRDANQRMNLYAVDLSAKNTVQLTHYADYDIKFPSLGDRAIVFEYGGYIHRFDLATERAVKVPVQILEDRASARGALVNVGRSVTNFEISPDGKRALFGGRGDVFTVPAKDGPTRNLTATPGVHERNSKWSPDGKTIAYIGDASGEDEIYVIPQAGGAAVQLTSGGDTYKYELLWSPDGSKILWNDKKLRLQYVDTASKKVVAVAQARAGEITSFAWSPDSKWIAYSRPEEDSLSKVYLYSVEQAKSFPVTDGWWASFSPAFSGDGKYLFFVSNRDFSPTYSRTEWNHIYQDLSAIYFVTLSRDTENPFKHQSDEVSAAAEPKKEEPKKEEPKKEEPKKDEGKKEEAKKDEARKPAAPAVKVDLEGIQDRVLRLPVAAGSYRDLASVGSAVYYIRQSSRDPRPAFQMYDLAQRKEHALGQVNGYEISADGKKILIAKDSSFGILDLPRGAANLTIGEPLNLSGMEVRLDRQAEWRQIFHECWRQMRDFFYDPNMHGVDWAAVRKKYEPLVPHVNHRADLTYVIGEMIGELNAGHTYVGGGEAPRAERVATGLLGAQLRRDPASQFFRFARILKGENWNPGTRSPLTEIGVHVQEGDYLLAINGKSTADMANPFEALVGTVGKQVVLKVGNKPSLEAAREVTVVPIADESELYYHEWVQGNIKKVSDATDGKVGYIHVPDMLTGGLNQFAKYFYPQLRKKGLIIDVRGNGGGNVSPMLIERLRRELAMVNMARNTAPTPNPADMMTGPMVCLLNEFSASDGDLFPFRFRKYKLGKLVGKRSWGGVIGIRGTLPLLDGGYLNKPEFAPYDAETGQWIIEGHGVDPDIFVDNDPAQEFAGKDQQLDKAIEVIKEELKSREKKLPPIPVFPKK